MGKETYLDRVQRRPLLISQLPQGLPDVLRGLRKPRLPQLPQLVIVLLSQGLLHPACQVHACHSLVSRGQPDTLQCRIVYDGMDLSLYCKRDEVVLCSLQNAVYTCVGGGADLMTCDGPRGLPGQQAGHASEGEAERGDQGPQEAGPDPVFGCQLLHHSQEVRLPLLHSAKSCSRILGGVMRNSGQAQGLSICSARKIGKWAAPFVAQDLVAAALCTSGPRQAWPLLPAGQAVKGRAF